VAHTQFHTAEDVIWQHEKKL